MNTINLNTESQTPDGRINILNALCTAGSTINWSVDQKCWQLYNNYIDVREFEYLTTPGGNALPAKFQHIPAQRPKINFLVGRQLDRPLQASVVCTDKRSLKEKKENKVKFYVDEYITRFRDMYNQVDGQIQEILEKKKEIEQSLQQKPENEDQQQQLIQAKKMLPQIEAKIETIRQSLQDSQIFTMQNIKKLENLERYTNQDYMEITAQKALKAYIQKLEIIQKNVQSFIAHLVTGKPRFYVDYRPGDKLPIYRPLQGHNVFYQAIDDIEWIEDLDWAGFEEYMSPQDVISEFGLTDEEKASIETDPGTNGAYHNDAGPFVTDEKGNVVDGGPNYVSSGAIFATTGVKVQRVWWVAERTSKTIVTPNKYRPGHSIYTFIGANDRKQTVIDRHLYHNELAYGEDGVKKSKWILNAQQNDTLPKEYDDKDVRTYNSNQGDELVVRYLSDRYKGVIINNEILRAWKDPIQPHTEENYSKKKLPIVGPTFNNLTKQPYSLIWATKEVQRMINVVSWHKELMLALAGTKTLLYDMIFKPEGMSDKEYRYNRKIGDMPVQTRKKGVGAVNQSNFNQWQVLDLSLSDSIQYLDKILDNLDGFLCGIMGISKQAMGQVTADDPVGTTKMSQQSVLTVTKVLYWQHDEVVRRALNMMMNLAKQYLWDSDTIMSYVNENSEQEIVEIPKGMFKGKDFEIIIVGNSKEEEKLDEMKNFALQNWSKGMLPFNNFMSIYSSDSMTEVRKMSEYFAEEAEKLMAQSKQTDLKNQSQLQEEKIKLQGQMTQMVEDQKRQIEKMAHDLEQQKFEFDKTIQAQELQLKSREIDVKQEAVQVKSQAEFAGTKVTAQVKQESNRANEKIKLLKIQLDSLADSIKSKKETA